MRTSTKKGGNKGNSNNPEREASPDAARFMKSSRDLEVESALTNKYGEFFNNLKAYQRYYIDILPYLIRPEKLPLAIGSFLLVFSHLQEAGLVLEYDLAQQNQESLPSFLSYLSYFLGRGIFSDYYNKSEEVEILLFASVILNVFIIIIALITMTVYLYDHKQLAIKIGTLALVICSIYNYCLFCPSVSASFIIISNKSTYPYLVYLGCGNLAVTISIGFTIAYHDFEFSFLGKNFLSKREAKSDLIRMIWLIGIILANATIGQKSLCFVALSYGVVKIILYWRLQMYLRRDTSSLYWMLISALCAFYFMATIHFYKFQDDGTNTNSGNSSIGVIMLILIGLAGRFGYSIHKGIHLKIYNKSLGKVDLSFLSIYELDLFLRDLAANTSFFFEDYIERGQAIIFESIYIAHKLSCKINDYTCFCYDFQREDGVFNLEDLIGQEYRRKFVLRYIINIYEKMMSHESWKRHPDLEGVMSYLSFVFEVLGVPTKSFGEFYNYKSGMLQRSSLNLKEIQSFSILFTRMNNTFSRFFTDPTIQNQRIMMMMVVEFEEKIVIFRMKLSEYLLRLGQFYDFLSSDYIRLKILREQANELLQENQELQDLMYSLFDLNPQNEQLLYASVVFADVVDYRNRRIHYFINKSKNITEQQLYLQEKGILQVFNPDSCIIYASLNYPGGAIKHVSKSFFDIFQCPTHTLFNLSLTSVVPKQVLIDHDDYVDNFKNKGTMNIIRHGERVVFALNQRGFIFAMFIRLKLENMIGELGVCSQLTKIREFNEIIMLDRLHRINDITEPLYNRIFSKNYSLHDIFQENVWKIMPVTFIIKDSMEFESPFSSVLIIPRNRSVLSAPARRIPSLASDNPENQKVENIQDLINFVKTVDETWQVYSIDISYRLLGTSIDRTYEYLEISNIQRIRSLDEKKLFIDKLTECVVSYSKYNKYIANGKTFNELNNMKFENVRSELQSIQSAALISQCSQVIEGIYEEETETAMDDKQKGEGGEDEEQFNFESWNKKKGVSLRVNGEETDIKNAEYKQFSSQTSLTCQYHNNFTYFNTIDKNNYQHNPEIDLASQFTQANNNLNTSSNRHANNFNTISENIMALNNKQSHSSLNDQGISNHSFLSKGRLSAVVDATRTQQGQIESTADRNEEPFTLKTDFDKDILPLETQHRFHDMNNYNAFSPKDTTIPLLQQTHEGHNLPELDIFPQTTDRKLVSSSTNEFSRKTKYESEFQRSGSQTPNKANSIPKRNHESSGSLGQNTQTNQSKTEESKARQQQTGNRKMKQSESSLGSAEEDDDENSETQEKLKENGEQNIEEEVKRSVIRWIRQRTRSNVLSLLKLASVISYVILICVSSVLFYELITALDIHHQFFEIIDVFHASNNISLKVLSQQSFLSLMSSSSGLLATTNNATYKLHEIQLGKIDLGELPNKFLEKLSILALHSGNQGSYSSDYKNSLLNTETKLNLTNSGMNVNSQASSQEYLNVNSLFMFITYEASIYQLVDNNNLISTLPASSFYNSINRIDFFWDNYSTMNTICNSMQALIQSTSLTQFTTINDIEIFNLSMLLLVVVSLVISLIPINYIAQVQIQKLLKLLGSFKPEKLQKYIDMIELSREKLILLEEEDDNMLFSQARRPPHKQLDSLLKTQLNKILQQNNSSTHDHTNNSQKPLPQTLSSNSLNPPNTHEQINLQVPRSIPSSKVNRKQQQIKRISNKRTRQVASFSNLSTVSIPILMASSFIIGILMIYPVTSLIVLEEFQDEGKVSVESRIALLDADNMFLDLQANHFGFWLQEFRLSTSLSTSTSLSQDMHRYTQTRNQITKLQSNSVEKFKRVSDLLNLQQIKRRDEATYNDIFLKILNENICEIYTIHPKLFDTDLFGDVLCTDLLSGILTKGYIIAMKHIAQVYEDLNQSYTLTADTAIINDFSQVKSAAQALINILIAQESSNTLTDLNKAMRIFSQIQHTLDNILFQAQEDYYNYILSISKKLFYFQIAVVTLTFILGSSLFFNKFSEELMKTKSLLKLFHISLIMDNSLCMAFFRKNKMT